MCSCSCSCALIANICSQRIKLNPTLGGQTTIFGKCTSEIGNVSIEVSMGDFSQSKKALLINKPAVIKPEITTTIQISLISEFLEVDI